MAAAAGNPFSWAASLAVEPGSTVAFRATGTLTSLLDQYATYAYAYECECPSALSIRADSVKVALIVRDGALVADITSLFTVTASGASLRVAAGDVLKAAGISKDSKLELTYQAQVEPGASAGDYAAYAHVEYSSPYDPRAIDASMEDGVTIAVRDRGSQGVQSGASLLARNMPATGDAALAGVLSTLAAGVITLLVGRISRRRKAQEG